MLTPGMHVKLKHISDVAPIWRGHTLEFVEYDEQNPKRAQFKVITAPATAERKIGKLELLRIQLVEIPDPKNNEEAMALLLEGDE